jgi:hypothetical protein
VYKHKIPFNIYHQVIRNGAIKAIQSETCFSQDAIKTPLGAVKEANRIASYYIKRLRSSGSQIFGDLSDLLSAYEEQEDAPSASSVSMPIDAAATFVAEAMDVMLRRFKDSAGNRAQ